MVTIIRSPRIVGEAVTLSMARHVASAPQSAPPPAIPPVGDTHTGQLPAPVPAAGKDADDSSIALRMREEQLLEREREIQEHAQRMQDELEVERQKVMDAAHAEGYKHGEEEGAKSYRERLDMLQNLIASLKEEFVGEIAGLEDVVVDIVFEAVCKIIGQSLHDRDGVRAVVQEVASRAKDQEKLILRVSPRDYALLCEDGDALVRAGQGTKHELIADDRVVLGGCLIETSGGTLDGRLEIQLQQLRETLISARKMLPE